VLRFLASNRLCSRLFLDALEENQVEPVLNTLIEFREHLDALPPGLTTPEDLLGAGLSGWIHHLRINANFFIPEKLPAGLIQIFLTDPMAKTSLYDCEDCGLWVPIRQMEFVPGTTQVLTPEYHFFSRWP
jgi:hypothetical protein